MQCQADGTVKQLTKAPSGKDISLAQKSVLNLQNVSKSVEKQAGNAGGAPGAAQKGVVAQGTPQQYLVINSNKEGKGRDSAKGRKESSLPSSKGGANVTSYANQFGSAGTMKEKRLSQHQAQQFVNNQ